MDLADWVEAAGGPGLAAAAFLGATLVPVSSEIAFVVALRLEMGTMEALTWATLGNSLGCALNYGLGRWGRERVGDQLAASRAERAALRWTERWGAHALLLSWMPIIGDSLTLAAGVGRVRPWVFAGLVVPLRVARYLALVPLG
ncbi:MAG: VTT domain-containing protein [Bacteroidota bacterium]